MNKKRFKYTNYDDGTSSIYDRIDDEYYFDMDLSELEELLNKMQDKNEQLKIANNSLKLLVRNWETLDEEKDEQLDKQNQALKKLKKENSNLRFEMGMYEQKIEDLEKELQSKTQK